MIEKPLCQHRGLRPLGLQAAQVQECVQTDQLESAVDRVRNAAADKEVRLASLRDNGGISALGSIAGWVTTEQRYPRL